jgi:hypothetical protein
MTGALVQLRTTNERLVDYKPHIYTNYACDTIMCNHDINVINNCYTWVISRNGDLITKFILVINRGNPSDKIPYYGEQLIKSVELKSGGRTISKFDGDWIHIYHQLHLSDEKRKMYEDMIGHNNLNETVYVPLNFWLDKNVKSFIPLVALQFQDITLRVQMKSHVDVKLDINYVYNDTKERRFLAQNTHKFLIEQVLTIHADLDVNSKINKILLPFSGNQVKELVWICKNNLTNTYTKIKQAKLMFNNLDRTEWKNGDYFSKIQQYKHHTNSIDNVYMFPFSVEPQKINSSGLANLAKMDIQLHIELEDVKEEYITIMKQTKLKILNKNIIDLIICNIFNDYQVELKVYAINNNHLIAMNGQISLQYNTYCQ